MDHKVAKTAQAKAEPKTLAEHRQFLQDMTRLQLWFVGYWLAAHPDETVASCLNARVDIIRKTIFNEGPLENTLSVGMKDTPGWVKLVEQISDVFEKTRHDGPEVFEAQAWQVCEPVVLPRAERDMAGPDPLANFQCGSLRYDLKASGDPPAASFHIGNRLKPVSIFADPAYLPACMRQLINAVRSELGVSYIRTGTWLNSYPHWLELFPRQWQDNMTEPNYNVTWSYGVWGQFVSARGTLNHRHANLFRQTGQVPFAHRASFCEIAQMEKHLDELEARRGDKPSNSR